MTSIAKSRRGNPESHWQGETVLRQGSLDLHPELAE